MSESNVLFSTGEVAKQVGLPRWKLQYLIKQGDVPGPSRLVAGQRFFTEDDIACVELGLKVWEFQNVGQPGRKTASK